MRLNITTGESGIRFNGENSRPRQRKPLSSQYDKDSRAREHEEGHDLRVALPRRLLAGLLVIAGLAPCPIGSQTNVNRTAAPTERCLLIVETSKSMQRRVDGVLGAVQDLLGSRLDGKFRDGGTLGIWTFNEELSAGRFPLQTWSASAQKEITQRTITFLKGQKYEKLTSFDKVAPALSRVIKESELITVILICSGDGKIRGTPFDDQINQTFQQWHDIQQKARLPFVTVLRARHGQVAAYVVNTPPWPLQVPSLPEETKGSEAARGKLLEALHGSSTPAAPPPIAAEKTSQPPEPASVPSPAPAVATPQASPPFTGVLITNAPAPVKPPEAAAPAVEAAKPEPAPAVPEKPAVESPPSAVPPPAPISEPRSESVKARVAMLAEPAPAKPAAVSPPPAPEPMPENAAVEQPKPSPTPEVKNEAAQASPAVHESSPAASAPTVTSAQPAPLRPASVEPPPAARPAPSAQSATAVPAESLLHSKTIWIAALLLIVVAAGLTLLLSRRSHAAPHGSLITRSFDRDHKP